MMTILDDKIIIFSYSSTSSVLCTHTHTAISKPMRGLSLVERINVYNTTESVYVRVQSVINGYPDTGINSLMVK